MSKAVQLENISKHFVQPLPYPENISIIKKVFTKRLSTPVQAVNDITFSIEQGETVAFVGPNGSGKSTTIKMMTGILFPDSGNIEVLGLNPQKQRVKLVKRIGCVFGQKSSLWYHLPPNDTFKLIAKIYECNPNDAKARTKQLIEAFEIGSVIDIPVRKLSLGQRMRCEIVASLIHRPEIIFLDEPTIGLDVIAKQQIRDELIRLNKEEGITVFLTSHDAGDIDQIANRTIVINFGELLYDGTTEDLKAHYVHEERVEVVAEPSMEDIIAEIYADAKHGRIVGGEQ